MRAGALAQLESRAATIVRAKKGGAIAFNGGARARKCIAKLASARAARDALERVICGVQVCKRGRLVFRLIGDFARVVVLVLGYLSRR